jgi:hypothetical protein
VFVRILGARTAELILFAKKTVNAGILSFSIEACQIYVNICVKQFFIYYVF